MKKVDKTLDDLREYVSLTRSDLERLGKELRKNSQVLQKIQEQINEYSFESNIDPREKMKQKQQILRLMRDLNVDIKKYVEG